MLGKPGSHYVLGPPRHLRALARWDLRKVNKYLELHARFGPPTLRHQQNDPTKTARLVYLGNRWSALYVQVPADSNVPADKVADGVEGVLAFQAANPNREPTKLGELLVTTHRRTEPQA